MPGWLTATDFARYSPGIQLMKDAAIRAGHRRLGVSEETHGVPVAVFLYSKIEAASLVDALDQVELTDHQQAMRDELQLFVVS